MRAKQSCGDPRSLCRYTQGRNISSSFFVNLDPCRGQGKKLWYVVRVYLDPKIDSYYCRTILASSKKKTLLSQVLKPGLPVSSDPPSWKSFTRVLRQPKNWAAGADHVSPHLYQWLPRELQWDLYIVVHHAWDSGNVPPRWL